MLCEVCRIREANVQYTEVVGGVRTEHHFCSQCAKDLDFGPYSAIFDGEFPFAEFLSALLGAETPAQKQDKYQQIVCPTCGMTYREFVKNSCFGCADCYSVFDVLIHDNIKQLQGSDSHKGKTPLYQNVGNDEDENGPVGEEDFIADGTGVTGNGIGGAGKADGGIVNAASGTGGAGNAAGGIGNAASGTGVTGNAAGGTGNITGAAGTSAAQAEKQIAILERRLKDALRKEEYETAALLRDQIRALKGGAQQNE